MGADMTVAWKEWEGRTVEEKFFLDSYLGGGLDGSGVFRTQFDGQPAVIKVAFLSAADAERTLRRWQSASELNHPHLIRILSVGRREAEGAELVYVVEEYAEENLAQIVPSRPLTAEETRGMLSPVLSALEYIHRKGLAHGCIRPSNILAVRDHVKLSSDTLRPVGEMPDSASVYDAPEVAASGVSTASDVWSLGMTLLEVMTQHVPAWDAARMTAPEISQDVVEPFRTIAKRCLEIDPAKRCGLTEIKNRLEGRAVEIALPVKPAVMRESSIAQAGSPKWPYLLVLAAVVGIVVFLFLRPRSSSEPQVQNSSAQSTANQPAPSPAPSEPPASTAAPSAPSRTAKTAAAQPKAAAQTKDDVVERVMPEVSPSARRTIQGTIKVRVKVNVDGDGNVTSASLTNPGPSKYFARVALEAARRWKFAPIQDKSEDKSESRAWTVLFAFKRGQTDASATRAR